MNYQSLYYYSQVRADGEVHNKKPALEAADFQSGFLFSIM